MLFHKTARQRWCVRLSAANTEEMHLKITLSQFFGARLNFYELCVTKKRLKNTEQEAHMCLPDVYALLSHACHGHLSLGGPLCFYTYLAISLFAY